MNRTIWTVLVLAVILELLLIQSWSDARGTADDEGTDKVGPTARLAGLVIASLFPITLVLLPWAFKLDGFSTGSIAIAAILEVALYWGWVKSPQQEGFWLFLATSGFMAVLVATTIVFYRLQREN